MPIQVHLPKQKFFNEQTNEFLYTSEWDLEFEHCLRSIAIWESKWKKPFLSDKPLSIEEETDYFRIMCITRDVPSDLFDYLPNEIRSLLIDYIGDAATATTFRKTNQTPNRQIITSELVYYWMISYNIPLEFENRHFNHLMTLIDVFNHKNAKQKKMTASERMALNKARREQMHTKG